jgi:peptidoglycan/xylan/chitin deacetylase (PgdA/CDA1 family)
LNYLCGSAQIMKKKVLIISLHRVGLPPKEATHRGLFITPKLLSFEIWLLCKLGYRFTTLKDAILQTNDKHAVVTFDDGYEDNYSNGLPVLAKYGVPATVFVVTGDIGRRAVVWDEAGEKLPADMISWEMLADLHQRGWEIGSHGSEHVSFEDRTPDRQTRLVKDSLAEIEEKLGTVPISFAYPYGKYNEHTKEALRRSGIRIAVTTEWPEPADISIQDDLLALKRIPIGGRSFHHFVKSASRTLRAIGITEVLKEFIPQTMNAWSWNKMSKGQLRILGRQNKT